MKRTTKILIAVLAVLVLAGAMLGIYLATRPAAAQGAKEITVEVIHSDQSSKTFTYRTDAEYLGEVLLAEDLVQGEDSQYGLMILTVDGEDAIFDESGAYWALYQNGEYAQTGADSTPIRDGDTFQLVYSK